MAWVSVKAIVTKGHGVASGEANDLRFPGGTIAMQQPFFRQRGLDLAQFYPGTLNLAISPYTYRVKNAKYTFRNVRWSPTLPAEDFSFFDCRVVDAGGRAVSGLIYYPHPETKPAHFQPADVLEVLTFYLHGVTYGAELTLEVDEAQLEIGNSIQV